MPASFGHNTVTAGRGQCPLSNELQNTAKLPAVYATFERAEDAERLIAAYSGWWAGWCRQPANLRFEGQRLSVKRAPEPRKLGMSVMRGWR